MEVGKVNNGNEFKAPLAQCALLFLVIDQAQPETFWQAKADTGKLGEVPCTHYLPSTNLARRGAGKGGSENPISKINSWNGSPSLSKYWSSGLSCLSVREKCLSKTKTWELNDTKRSKFYVNGILLKKKIKSECANFPKLAKDTMYTFTKFSKHQQTEDTTHSWTSRSKRLKPEDKYQHLEGNQSKPHVS